VSRLMRKRDKYQGAMDPAADLRDEAVISKSATSNMVLQKEDSWPRLISKNSSMPAMHRFTGSPSALRAPSRRRRILRSKPFTFGRCAVISFAIQPGQSTGSSAPFTESSSGFVGARPNSRGETSKAKARTFVPEVDSSRIASMAPASSRRCRISTMITERRWRCSISRSFRIEKLRRCSMSRREPSCRGYPEGRRCSGNCSLRSVAVREKLIALNRALPRREAFNDNPRHERKGGQSKIIGNKTIPIHSQCRKNRQHRENRKSEIRNQPFKQL